VRPNQYSNALYGRFNIGFGATNAIRNFVAGSKPSRFWKRTRTKIVTGCAQPAPQCHASEYENTQLEKSQKSQEQDFCRFLLLRIEAHVRPIIFFAQRLVIVYQGLVRIPESKI